MPKPRLRVLLLCLVVTATSAPLLAATGSAQALSPRITIGGSAAQLPAVAVDTTGAANLVWNDPTQDAVDFCTVPLNATGCTHRQTLQLPSDNSSSGHSVIGSPSITLVGSTIEVFAYDNGGGTEEGVAGWTSTDGGATFSLKGIVSYAPPNNDSLTTNAVQSVGNGLVSVGYVVPQGSPEVQTVTFDPATSTYDSINRTTVDPPFASLQASDDAGNLGGMLAVGGTQLMGAITAFPASDAANPCGDGHPYTTWSLANLTSATKVSLNASPGAGGSSWTHGLTKLDCSTENPAVAGGPAGFGVLDSGFTNAATYYHRFDAATGAFDIAPVTLFAHNEVYPSLSQDGAGGVYATFATGLTDVDLAYSPDGGTTWDGPVVLQDATATGRIQGVASAVSSAGQGWATYVVGGTLFAQPFTAKDVGPQPVTVSTSQTSGTAQGAQLTIAAGTVGETDTATLTGVNATTAAGTVSYALFPSATCTGAPVVRSTVAVTNGAVPPSAPVTAALDPGSWYWQAGYSGDARNAPAVSTCGSEVLKVKSAATVSGSTTVTVSGGGTVTITCVTSATCAITITVTYTKTASGHAVALKPKTITLGKASGQIKGHHSSKLRFSLTKAGKNLLLSKHNKVTAVLTLSDKTKHGTIRQASKLKVTLK